MLRTVKLTAIAVAAIAAATAAYGDCDHSKQLRISPVDAAGIKLVRIDASSGSLEVTGTANRTITAGGLACASTASRLEEIELTSERRGDELRVKVDIESSQGVFFRRTYARLDLKVELPRGMSVEIDDGSGEIEVRDVGALDIDDGSGSIMIQSAGTTRIDDGSGSISVRNVSGDLSIEDGSGEIDVQQVSGTVRIDDGSGSVEVNGIGGSVIIEDDGSGSIRVTDVRGDLRVGDHGSGGLSFDGIDGKVSVRD